MILLYMAMPFFTPNIFLHDLFYHYLDTKIEANYLFAGVY